MKTSMRSLLACVLLSSGLYSATSSAAQTWDAAADFNVAQTGAWSYGWSATLGGAFTQVTAPTFEYGMQWLQGQGATYVYNNPTSSALNPAGTIYAAPGVLAEHPGSGGQYAVVRWTAQQSGTYSVNAGFYGISAQGQATSTDVHVLKNGASQFDGLVEGHWANENVRVGTSAPLTFALQAGDKVDFVVGYGSNGNYLYDSTRLTATIAAVPEPETYAMLLAGLGLMGGIARRRKAKQA